MRKRLSFIQLFTSFIQVFSTLSLCEYNVYPNSVNHSISTSKKSKNVFDMFYFCSAIFVIDIFFIKAQSETELMLGVTISQLLSASFLFHLNQLIQLIHLRERMQAYASSKIHACCRTLCFPLREQYQLSNYL